MRNLFLVLMAAITLMSCENAIRNIPSGYIGKVLTPTGWQKGIIEAGQHDIGITNNNGTSNSLVLMEATTTTVKESFSKEGEGGEDHRVRTLDRTPLSVDIYVQIAIPVDENLRDGAFASITPKATGTDRVSVISITDVYDKFVKMIVRGKVREIFAKYKNADEIMQKYAVINAEIGAMVLDVFKQSKAPCELIGAQLSNVKEDADVLASQNQLVAADNKVKEIEKIGEALKNNPQYAMIKKWDALQEIAKSGKNVTIIVSDGRDPVIAIPNK